MTTEEAIKKAGEIVEQCDDLYCEQEPINYPINRSEVDAVRAVLDALAAATARAERAERERDALIVSHASSLAFAYVNRRERGFTPESAVAKVIELANQDVAAMDPEWRKAVEACAKALASLTPPDATAPADTEQPAQGEGERG